MKKSQFLSLGLADVVKGFITAAITSALTALYLILQSGRLPTKDDIVKICLNGLTAGLGYLIKNVFTNSDDEFAKPENK